MDTQRTTPGRAAIEAVTPDLRSEAERLLRAVYRLPGFDPADRYSLHQVQLWAKNEPHTQDMLGDEEHEARIWAEVEQLLAANEDRVFRRRASRFAKEGDQDQLGHLRHGMRGLTWPAAKRLVWSLLPGGAAAGPVDDEMAEGAFQTLQRTARGGAWASSAAWADQRDKAWRLSAARVHQDRADAVVDQASLRRYEQTLLARHYFSQGVPEVVTVYRGVPRPDATVRPGDYVTLDREMARGFVRGRHGVIVTARLPADDLLVMRADPGATELIYWPRGTPAPATPDATSYLPVGREGYTLRQLWQEVNGAAGRLRENAHLWWYRLCPSISTQQRLATVYDVLDKVTGGYKVAPDPNKRVCVVYLSRFDHYATVEFLLTQDEAEALWLALERLDRHELLRQRLGEASQRRFVDVTSPNPDLIGVLKAHGLRFVGNLTNQVAGLDFGWYMFGIYHRPGVRWRVPPGVYEVRHRVSSGGAWCWWFKTTPEEAEMIFRKLERKDRLAAQDALRESRGWAEAVISQVVQGEP